MDLVPAGGWGPGFCRDFEESGVHKRTHTSPARFGATAGGLRQVLRAAGPRGQLGGPRGLWYLDLGAHALQLGLQRLKGPQPPPAHPTPTEPCQPHAGSGTYLPTLCPAPSTLSAPSTPPLKATPQPRVGFPVSQGPQPAPNPRSLTPHILPQVPEEKPLQTSVGIFFLCRIIFFSRHSLFFFPFSFYSKHCKYRNISLYNRTTVYSGGRAGTHTPGPRHPRPSAGTALPAPESRDPPGDHLAACVRSGPLRWRRQRDGLNRIHRKPRTEESCGGQVATPPT